MTYDVSACSLYLCTPDRPDLERFVSDCITGGIDIVQLREKHLEARQLIKRAKLVARVCKHFGVPFIMNDRPDIAIEVDADGVHVGQDDVPVHLVRELIGEEKIVGLSTHSLHEFTEAMKSQASYLSVGPIVETPTKPGRDGTGLAYVSKTHEIASQSELGRGRMPLFVTGGVTPDSIPEIAAHGASRFVVVRYLTQSTEPREAAHQLRAAVDKVLETRG